MKRHYFSRSARDEDDICPRRRFYGTVYDGRGLTPAGEAIELTMGTGIHVGMACMWLEFTWEEIKEKLQEHECWGKLGPMDQWLLLGLLRIYFLVVYPTYKDWLVLKVEEELFINRGWLTLLCQPDVILKSPDGRVRYLEYKSTKLLTPKYIESWRYSPQLAAGVVAAKETLDLTVDECVMGFFYKGEPSHDGTYWNHPLTSFWRKQSEDPNIYLYSPKRPSYWKGWERFDPSQEYSSVEEWVDFLVERFPEVLAGLVPESQPHVVHPTLVVEWITESFIREEEIALFQYDQSDAGDLPEVFPHRFRQCRPVIGNNCPFLDVCWNPTLRPLESGLYTLRVPHHETERIALLGA